MSESKNKISDITRRYIADDVNMQGLYYHGRRNEPDFLGRFFNLKELPSNDDRYTNAYDDIYQHMVMNNDWDVDWIYSDPRINMLYAQDELYLKFLSDTIHPLVRPDVEQVSNLLTAYNKYLNQDGFEIYVASEQSSRPIFAGRSVDHAHLADKGDAIKKFLNTDYVRAKIDLINRSLNSNTDLALGQGKDLLETACKSILRAKGVPYDKEWTLMQLVKQTISTLNLSPKEADDAATAEKAIRQIVGGLNSIVGGVSELRNAYGTGHGKEADFKGLEPRFAKLYVGAISDIILFFLSTEGEDKELIEE